MKVTPRHNLKTPFPPWEEDVWVDLMTDSWLNTSLWGQGVGVDLVAGSCFVMPTNLKGNKWFELELFLVQWALLPDHGMQLLIATFTNKDVRLVKVWKKKYFFQII